MSTLPVKAMRQTQIYYFFSHNTLLAKDVLLGHAFQQQLVLNTSKTQSLFYTSDLVFARLSYFYLVASDVVCFCLFIQTKNTILTGTIFCSILKSLYSLHKDQAHSFENKERLKRINTCAKKVLIKYLQFPSPCYPSTGQLFLFWATVCNGRKSQLFIFKGNHYFRVMNSGIVTFLNNDSSVFSMQLTKNQHWALTWKNEREMHI